MSTNQQQISEEMYHRIYRLIKRNYNAHTIAATLKLPVHTIQSVINRLKKQSSSSAHSTRTSSGDASSSFDSEFLDIYVYYKTRYAIVDLVGTLSDSYTKHLKTELDKIATSSWKAVAIRMTDVTSISETASAVLLNTKEKFNKNVRYLALLDPSPTIENDLSNHNLESAIPVFGTERAFEEAAFSKKGKMLGRRETRNRT